MTRFASVLAEAADAGRAVGAFTCYDLLGFEAVVRAAQARSAPVIVLVGPGSFAAEGGERLVAAFRAAAAGAGVPVLIQLDHVGDRELIARAAGAGVDAVMADGSRLPDDENLAFSAAVAEELRPLGIAVEAELGRVEGDEDLAALAAAGALTDPAGPRPSCARAASAAWRSASATSTATTRARPRWTGSGSSGCAARARRCRCTGRPASRTPTCAGRWIAGDRQGQRQHRAAGGLLRRAGLRRGRTPTALDLRGLGEKVIGAVANTVDAKLALLGWGP